MIEFGGKTELVKGVKNIIKKTIKQILDDHLKKAEQINVVFVSDDELLEMNKTFLKHDYYTDIITHDLSDNDLIFGELYISYDRIKENAEKNKVLFHVELERVIYHGVLHLVGYKDKKKSDKEEMTKQENKYLNLN
ncbi:MAG: rRNA maturation RNase YbeY [Bacteroidota bacterium]|nr:rRNA maturation RNase YbeY [Bacteroidota bacterium]